MTRNCFYCESYKAKIPSILLGILAFAFVFQTTRHGSEHYRELNTGLIAPPELIQHLTFGYSEVTADMLWIRAIQDFDYCDKPLAKNLCTNNSWLYQMLEAITNLSPEFRIPYAAGGLALTVLISDIDGATKIFDKGVAHFPKDWPILYRAGYHYLYEVKDRKRAAELFSQAAANGAPPWLYSLAGRLYSDSGNVELAEQILQGMIQSEQDPKLVERLREKIESIKSKKSL